MQDITENPVEHQALDMASIDIDIITGARAYTKLLAHSADDWNSWEATIIGLRALRSLAYAKAGTSNMNSQAYRDAMSRLLMQRKYAAYGQMEKQDRSACYRLMDRIEEISVWYAGLKPTEKMRWKHPESIAKHCPRHLIAQGMRGHNRPPKGKKKPLINAETERLKALLIQVIKRLAKFDPTALDLLDQISPADPVDNVEDLYPEETSG
jgi:hypothetical protein